MWRRRSQSAVFPLAKRRCIRNEAALEGSVQGRQRYSRQVCTFTAEHITMYAPAM